MSIKSLRGKKPRGYMLTKKQKDATVKRIHKRGKRAKIIRWKIPSGRRSGQIAYDVFEY